MASYFSHGDKTFLTSWTHRPAMNVKQKEVLEEESKSTSDDEDEDGDNDDEPTSSADGKSVKGAQATSTDPTATGTPMRMYTDINE